MIAFAYISYILSELLSLSGIFAVFICAVLMAHYHWYSISPLSRTALFLSSRFFFKMFPSIIILLCSGISYFAETGSFLALGLTLFTRPHALEWQNWSPTYLIASLVCFFFSSSSFLFLSLIHFTLQLCCLIARAVAVIPISLFLNIFRKSKINMKQIFMQWWSGNFLLLLSFPLLCCLVIVIEKLISGLRGAVAIILALGLGNGHDLFVNSVYFIVLFTNLVMGLTTKPIIKWLGIPTGEKGISLNTRPIEEVLLAFLGISFLIFQKTTVSST